MIVMLSNNRGQLVKDFHQLYPDRIAMMNNPFSVHKPIESGKHCLDNGAFVKFDEGLFFKAIDKLIKYPRFMWVVAPDVVGCHDRTLALWHYYHPILKSKYDVPLAFVAQDGW